MIKLSTVQFRDQSALSGLTGITATSMLTEEFEPERDELGWIVFKAGGQTHRVPPDLVRRVTEYVAPAPKMVEVPFLVSKRGKQKS